MEERYVISVKARKDVMGRDCEEWRYAGIDDGLYGSGYPCWCYSDYSCKSFGSIEAAKEWFNKSKSFLLVHIMKKMFLILKLLVLER